MNLKSKIQFYLIRHGQTERNANPDLIGQSATEPLSELGRKQAELLGNRLTREKVKFDYVYTSPYTRALETYHIACKNELKNITSTVIPELREVNQGDGIDKSRKELFTPEFKELLTINGMGFKFPNGESLFEVEHRAKTWLEAVIADPFLPTHKELTVGVFSHGMTIKCLLHLIMNFDQRFTWRVNIENTSITKLSLREGTWFLECVNDYSHLAE